MTISWFLMESCPRILFTPCKLQLEYLVAYHEVSDVIGIMAKGYL